MAEWEFKANSSYLNFGVEIVQLMKDTEGVETRIRMMKKRGIAFVSDLSIFIILSS